MLSAFKENIQRHNTKQYWLAFGIFTVCLFFLPYMISGENASFIVHDQFDGEMENYILQARHLMDRSIPEMFGGTAKTSIALPAPAFVFLYLLFSPIHAFFIQHFIIIICAYLGMYLLMNEMTKTPWIAYLSAVLFCILPFYTVYGLSVMGQPLLIYFFVRILQNKHTMRNYLGIVFSQVVPHWFWWDLQIVGYCVWCA